MRIKEKLLGLEEARNIKERKNEGQILLYFQNPYKCTSYSGLIDTWIALTPLLFTIYFTFIVKR